MGVLTGLVEVDRQLFLKCRTGPNRKLLLEVISGWKEPEVLDLPNDYKFNRISQDKAWDDITYLLDSLDVHPLQRVHERGRKITKHPDLYFYFYHPKTCLDNINSFAEGMLIVDSMYEAMGNPSTDLKLVELEEKKYKYKSKAIAKESLQDAFKLLGEFSLQKWKDNTDKDKFTGYWGDPMHEFDIDYILQHYTEVIQIMTDALYEKNDEGEIVMKHNYVFWSQS